MSWYVFSRTGYGLSWGAFEDMGDESVLVSARNVARNQLGEGERAPSRGRSETLGVQDEAEVIDVRSASSGRGAAALAGGTE